MGHPANGSVPATLRFRTHPQTHHRMVIMPANRSERLYRPVQFLWIERLPLFPDSQCDRGDLPRQRQPCHLGAHSFPLETLQIAPIRFGPAPSGCGANEGIFQTSIAVPIQAPRCDRFSTSQDAAVSHLILGAHVRHDSQPAVTPQRMLRSKPMRRIDRRHDQGAPDRSQLRNRFQQPDRLMESAFGQPCLFRPAPEFTQLIQLFV